MTELLEHDAFDRALVAQVHPAEWRNPTPAGRYNLVVVGGGTAGLVSAAGAAALGARVALVERHLLGGDCLNFGCVPSKALLRAARAAADVRAAPDFGISTGAVEVDFAAAMARMRRLRAGLAKHDSAARFRGLGVDVFLGQGEFVAPGALVVGGTRLDFARAVIATGARATMPAIPGLREAGALSNETVFALEQLPHRLVVIGAGPIGCELAQAFARLGSRVTVLTQGAAIMPREDLDAAAVVAARLTAEGVELVLGARVLRVEQRATGKAVRFQRGSDSGAAEEVVEGDQLLVAVGRTPNLDGLGLAAAEVESDASGVRVDDHLRTSNRRIYAAGDVCSRWKFTHAADAMARIVLANALFFGRRRASALVVPWCTYTDPEVAHVGLTEAEARARGLAVQTFTVALTEVDRAVLDGDEGGFARVHTDRKGRILGATLVGRHAGESIGEVVLAMTQGVRLGALSGVIHPYPTQADALRRLGDAWQRTRLTPRLQRLLAWLLRHRR